MKVAWMLLLSGVLAAAAEKKPAAGNTGNDDIEIAATAFVDPADIKAALGADLGAGFLTVRIKVSPKTEGPMRVSPDDFTLLSHKDGQRSGAYAPSQIAGNAALIVRSTSSGGGVGVQDRGPVWGGIGGPPRRLGGEPGGVGNMGSTEGRDSKIESNTGAKENPLLKLLAGKILPDKETKEPVEGLLYFLIEGKVKGKELSLLYKGPAGRLVLEFREPK
jgi:hypothetical protein